MYRTESLVQYFPRLAFLNFIFDFILSCFFLYLKVYANEQNVNNDVTKDSLIWGFSNLSPFFWSTMFGLCQIMKISWAYIMSEQYENYLSRHF